MALQGTLETFALPDVLRLLATTKKTGCYRLDGDRGSGRLWVRDGHIVAGDVSGSKAVIDPSEVAFELLRFDDGEFLFQADAVAPREGNPQDVESVLDAADQMLVEWHDIEAVVPSLDAWVTLRPELPADEVTIRADTWVSVVAIGSGCTVARLGQIFGLGELAVSRVVKELVELGIIDLQESAAPHPGPAYQQPEPAYEAPYAEPAYEGSGYGAPSYEPAYETPEYESTEYRSPEYEPAQYEAPQYEEPAYQGQAYEEPAYDPRYGEEEPYPAPAALDQSYNYDDLAAPDGNVIEFTPYGEPDRGYDPGRYESPGNYESYDSGSLLEDTRVPQYPSSLPPPPQSATRTVSYEADPTDAAEIARQLANLSPRAAKAVAAAAKATTQAEREAALAQVDETEDSINRDLLLKFLGSVNS